MNVWKILFWEKKLNDSLLTLRIFCCRLSMPSAPFVKSSPTPLLPKLLTTSKLESEPPRRMGTGMLRMLTSLPRSAWGNRSRGFTWHHGSTRLAFMKPAEGMAPTLEDSGMFTKLQQKTWRCSAVLCPSGLWWCVGSFFLAACICGQSISCSGWFCGAGSSQNSKTNDAKSETLQKKAHRHADKANARLLIKPPFLLQQMLWLKLQRLPESSSSQQIFTLLNQTTNGVAGNRKFRDKSD